MVNLGQVIVRERIDPERWVMGTVPHPGTVIKDLISETTWTQRELAERLGVTQKHLSRIITGKSVYSADFAIRLELATTLSARFWYRLVADYELDQAMLRFEDEEKSCGGTNTD